MGINKKIKAELDDDLRAMQVYVDTALFDIARQKKEHIKRILKMLDLPLDLLSDEEANRTFPRLAVKIHQDVREEKWYYNDGSEQGLCIATFNF